MIAEAQPLVVYALDEKTSLFDIFEQCPGTAAPEQRVATLRVHAFKDAGAQQEFPYIRSLLEIYLGPQVAENVFMRQAEYLFAGFAAVQAVAAEQYAHNPAFGTLRQCACFLFGKTQPVVFSEQILYFGRSEGQVSRSET